MTPVIFPDTSRVADLAAMRARRLERAATAAPSHPALKWAAAPDLTTAHRRRENEAGAWCGAPGQLYVAMRGTELCPACYATLPQAVAVNTARQSP